MLAHLLERIDKDEFETLSEDIKRSLAEHREWMRRISISLVSGVAITDLSFVAPDAYLHCQFGKWMQHILADEAFQHESFLKIDQLHRELHHSAKELMDRVAGGHKLQVTKYEYFLDVQKQLFDEILLVFEFSVANTYKYDSMTKLMNRRTVDTVLAHEHHRMQRAEDSTCCIALGDIDKFKAFNDTYGHDVGDRVLEHCATVFLDAIRRHDTVARYGGEEFLFIFPEMSIDDAAKTIERVRKNLQDTGIEHNGQLLSVTASFGVTQLCQQSDIKESVKRADIALYQAKKMGRNRTVSINIDNMRDDLEAELEAYSSECLNELAKKHCQEVVC